MEWIGQKRHLNYHCDDDEKRLSALSLDISHYWRFKGLWGKPKYKKHVIPEIHAVRKWDNGT